MAMNDLIQIKSNPKFPISVTETAYKKMIEFRDLDDSLPEDAVIRVSCKGGGCSGVLFNIDFDDEIEENDFVKEFSYNEKTIKVVVDPYSATPLQGVTVDFVQTGLVSGFRFEGGDKVKKTCGCGKSFSM